MTTTLRGAPLAASRAPKAGDQGGSEFGSGRPEGNERCADDERVDAEFLPEALRGDDDEAPGHHEEHHADGGVRQCRAEAGVPEDGGSCSPDAPGFDERDPQPRHEQADQDGAIDASQCTVVEQEPRRCGRCEGERKVAADVFSVRRKGDDD